jgi:hypothetical protein
MASSSCTHVWFVAEPVRRAPRQEAVSGDVRERVPGDIVRHENNSLEVIAD